MVVLNVHTHAQTIVQIRQVHRVQDVQHNVLKIVQAQAVELRVQDVQHNVLKIVQAFRIAVLAPRVLTIVLETVITTVIITVMETVKENAMAPVVDGVRLHVMMDAQLNVIM